jgi:Putative adhesin
MNGETTMTVTSPAGLSGPLSPLRMTPGRWAALAVAVPVALALIGWAGFSLVSSVARGSYQFTYAVPVQDGRVSLSVNADGPGHPGSVTLRQAPASGAARLTGTVQYGLLRPDVSEWIGPDLSEGIGPDTGQGSTPVGVAVGLDCAGVGAGDCGMNASLAIPPRTGVTLWSNGGDIAASGFSSGVALSAAGGNITATNLTGNVQLDSGGGDLTGGALTGTLLINAEGGNVNAGNWATTGTMRVDTGGGDFTANGLTGDLLLAAEGGNIQANGVAAAAASISSGGGDVTLAFSQAPQNLLITAEGGNVTVILPPGNTTYDISTPDTEGGNVSYPSSLASSASHRAITIDSGGGDITIG